MYLLSTGARLNEALTATWSQVDRERRVWRIPASNSKSKKIRSVPLNDSAIDVLNQLDTEGNSDPSVTQRYAHLGIKALQDAANSASVIIKGAMQASA
jgi:integrase